MVAPGSCREYDPVWVRDKSRNRWLLAIGIVAVSILVAVLLPSTTVNPCHQDGGVIPGCPLRPYEVSHMGLRLGIVGIGVVVALATLVLTRPRAKLTSAVG